MQCVHDSSLEDKSTHKILPQIKVKHLSYLISNEVRHIILHNLSFTNTMSFPSRNVEKILTFAGSVAERPPAMLSK